MKFQGLSNNKSNNNLNNSNSNIQRNNNSNNNINISTNILIENGEKKNEITEITINNNNNNNNLIIASDQIVPEFSMEETKNYKAIGNYYFFRYDNEVNELYDGTEYRKDLLEVVLAMKGGVRILFLLLIIITY